VETIAPHREEAFAACQFVIAEMKRVVPIWKKACPV
jgi:molybdopterin synthase catalytic subunit